MAENGAKRIRLGMVGGGTGAFIGYVHRVAARRRRWRQTVGEHLLQPESPGGKLALHAQQAPRTEGEVDRRAGHGGAP